ncbi:MAG TPA: PaaI family thioesterase [Burkholderiaceae bacterium]
MTDDRSPLPFALDIPFVEALGMQLWRFDGGHAELSLELQPHMRNSWQVAHGGVVMTLLDVAMAHAARSARPGDDAGAPGVVTLEMKTSFLRPAQGRLVAHGTLLHGGGRTAFCEGRVLDAGGTLCAHATGTFRFTTALRRDGA